MTYSGKRLFNRANLFLIFWIILGVLWLVYKPTLSTNLVTFICITVIIFSIYKISANTFYFIVKDNELVIKNYLRPFISRRFDFRRIKSIQIREMTRAYKGYDFWIGIDIKNKLKFTSVTSSTLQLADLVNMVSHLRRNGLDVDFLDDIF